MMRVKVTMIGVFALGVAVTANCPVGFNEGFRVGLVDGL